MSKLPWFRMHTEVRKDSKLLAMTDRERWIWLALLCYSAEQEVRGTVDYIDPEFVAIELQVGVDELDTAISRMVRLRLIERDDTYLFFPKFHERQYEKPSDHPDRVRDRVRKCRSNKQGDVTGNAPVTPHVTPTDTDTEHKALCDSEPVDNPRHIRDVIRSEFRTN